jgi:hypothetical protein
VAHILSISADGTAEGQRELPLDAPLGPGAAVVAAREATGETWVLITDAASRTLVNGDDVPLGIRVLQSGDEIRTHDGTTVGFSDERHADVVTYSAGSHPVRCGRCTTELEAGLTAVRCPSCSSWYHEHPEFPCWSSVPFCAVCGFETAPHAHHAPLET